MDKYIGKRTKDKDSEVIYYEDGFLDWESD